MSNPPDLHRAIEQLDATLHPKPEADSEPIALTEEMRIATPAMDDDTRQQLIAEVEQAIHAQLPQLIAEAVDQALANAAGHTRQ